MWHRNSGFFRYRLRNLGGGCSQVKKIVFKKKSIWKEVATMLYSRRNFTVGPLLWGKKGSFFWHNLFSIRCFFQLATRWTVVDGDRISFWFDNWAGRPLRFLTKEENSFINHKFISFKRAAAAHFTCLQRPLSSQDSHLSAYLHQPNNVQTQHVDSIRWIFSKDGSFSASSFYQFLVGFGKIESPYSLVWQMKLTPTLKLFSFLRLHGKLLTQEVLEKRGIWIAPWCHFCKSRIRETLDHLFMNCPMVYPFIRSFCCLLPESNQPITMRFNVSEVATQFMKLKGPSNSTTAFFVALYFIWKERNSRIFRDAEHPLMMRRQEVWSDAATMFFC